MPLTHRQAEIARVLADAWRAAGEGARIVWQTEWLGYLPYGQYQWVDLERADGKDDVSRRFPDSWDREDVLALEAAGLLRRLSETREPADDMHRIVYEMREQG